MENEPPRDPADWGTDSLKLPGMISLSQIEWMIEKGRGNGNPNEGEDPPPPPPPHGEWEAEPRRRWVRSDPSLPAMGWSDEFEPNRPVEQGEARKSVWKERIDFQDQQSEREIGAATMRKAEERGEGEKEKDQKKEGKLAPATKERD
jgi:hypothetical protein